MLKIPLIDEYEGTQQEKIDLAIRVYAEPLWIELLVASYLMPIGASLSHVSSKIPNSKVLLIVPSVIFVVCLALSQGLPKFDFNDELWIMWAPNIITTIWIVIVGYILLPSKGATQNA